MVKTVGKYFSNILNNKKLHGETDPDLQPHIQAQRQWNFQVMRSHYSLIFWQIVAVFALALLGIAMLYAYNNLSQPKFIPYIVTVDSMSGDVKFRGMLNREQTSLTDPIIQYYLRRFVEDIRSVSADFVVLKKQLSDAYVIATSSCVNQLTEYIQGKESPLKNFDPSMRVDIKMLLYEKISDKQWRCQWEELIRKDGILADKRFMSGVFSYKQIPHNEENPPLDENPVALYFTDYYIAPIRSAD